jgi:hypothetical protein
MAILKNQIGARFRKGTVKGILDYYRIRFSAVNMDRACEILVGLGCADDTFYWGYDRWTPHKVLQNVNSDNPVHNWLAKNVLIQFAGGPPNKWCIFQGTLLSMMLDRIAVVVLLEGLNTLNSIIGMCERYID